MTFHSILFESGKNNLHNGDIKTPAFFIDLNLDQVIDSITSGREEYNLKPFFYTSLKGVDEIKYRHEIMQDLENINLFNCIKAFSEKMRFMREHLIQSSKLYNKYQKEMWFLDAVEIYCDAAIGLTENLSTITLKSRGLLAFREYMISYSNSDYFTSLFKEAKKLKTDFSEVKYTVLIKDTCVKVNKYEFEDNYSTEILKVFEKFKQEAAKERQFKFDNSLIMNHVEEQILDLVAELYPDLFLNFDNYCANNSNYLNETIAIFDREIQFYIAYLEYISVFKGAGLKFCYPQISDTCKEIYNHGGFDLALAYKLITQNSSIVCNDFYLKDKERIFIVSGPNQGGKTTFARTFGQLHYMASIGCLVPGTEAKLFLFDNIFTHFEKEENIKNLSGKLQDDLVRINYILSQATPSSIIIMNEIFNSTTLKDAIFLGKKIMEKIIQLDLLCVCVTFIEELTSLGDKTVSMVSTIVPENPALRTFKIIRMPADGLSYAISIAEKYQLTYDCIKERIK